MDQARASGLPLNVWVLSGTQALATCSVPMMVLVGGLLAKDIAPRPQLATLPLTAVIVGSALASVPTALLLQRTGRKRGTYVGFAFALAASGLGYGAAVGGSFGLLILAGLCMGISVAFGQQLRFAALESVGDPKRYGAALSALMVGGLVAAFVGPEIGALGRDLLPSKHGFAGSFALLGVVVALGAVVFGFYREPERRVAVAVASSRPLREIVGSRAFFVAAATAAVAYGVMSFVMTATPITMTELCGYSLDSTKRVIQLHIAAMYVPSLAGGWLMGRLGAGRLMALGVVCFAGALGLGLSGQEIMHFGAGLVLLGVGWNFLFVAGTSLLPASYRPEERFKAQAANDFVVFGCQAVASLSAGWFVFSFGWEPGLWACAPFVALAGVLAVWQWLRGLAAGEG